MEGAVDSHSEHSRLHVALVGGGLHNGLLALMFLSKHPQARVTVFEAASTLGGNHTWCFYHSDCPGELMALLRPYLSHQWDGTDVRFVARHRTLGQPYYCLTSAGLNRALVDLQSRYPTLQIHTGCKVIGSDRYSVTTADGMVHRANVVVDSRGPETMAPHAGAWQVFLGQQLELTRPHGLRRPVVMDANVDQSDGLRFVYVLPLDQDRVLVEDTYFVEHRGFAPDTLRGRIAKYAQQHGYAVRSVIAEECGALPLATEGTDPSASTDPIRGGYAGGWFHPVTGYSFPLAARFACRLAAGTTEQDIAESLADMATEAGSQNRFFYWLNRMLYTGFLPHHRISVLEHFYRVPEDTIARFYSATMTPLDRARVLFGRPPKHLRWSSLPQSFRAYL